ncbi:restriction endonuclease subunit S [Aquicoccus sp. G2-2]|uniref:restriction endonuclease subunit S n=1 Tax=Aquicoccus sp. G2-2 TaxID=3092120 RepID=UPI002AE057D7|nr:restriction endonuclease subunit S [Aquicoccus sp. G2-2]MEA1115308.1 restriction endonuclease subunit S [Aquicoccus sp. G2-2]
MSWSTHATSDLISDAVLEIGDGYRAKNAEMSTDGVPFVRAGDVNGRVNTVGTDLLSTASVARVGRKRSMAGDVVMTTKGTIGRLAFVKVGDPEFIYSPQLCYWRSLDRNKIEPRWLFYAMRSQEMANQISWSAGQTDMAPYVSLTDQRTAFKITLPPIYEQRNIAAMLGALDDKIELNRRMSATLEEMARALYRSWFVDFDPVHARALGQPPAHMDPTTAALFPDSFAPDGLPKGWEAGTLSHLIEFNPKERLPKGTAAPYLEMKALPTSGMSADAPYLREFTSGTKFRERDTLLARITPCLENGKTAVVDDLLGSEVGWGSTEFIVMRAKPGVSAALPYCIARDPDFRAEAIQTMTGSSGRQRADARRISELDMAIAPAPVHTAFSDLVCPMLDRVIAAGQEARNLAALRGALLPRLMSGELRIREAEKQVEEVV